MTCLCYCSSFAFDETSSYWSAQKAPNYSALHWSLYGNLISTGQRFVTKRVVHLPKKTETSLITESDQTRMKLHGPSMFAVKAKHYGVFYNQSSSIAFDETSSYLQRRKAPYLSTFHWSPHGSLISIGQRFVTTRVVHLPKKTKQKKKKKTKRT